MAFSTGAELSGRTVLVTRAPDQANALADALRARGAAVVELPTIRILPPASYGALDEALGAIDRYAMVIVGSRNSALAIVGRARHLGITIDLPIGCVGERTRAIVTAEASVFRGPTVAPETFRAEALIPAITGHFGQVAGLRFLHPRAPEGRELIREALESKGAIVDQVEAYQIRAADPISDKTALDALSTVDTVTFLSGETIAAFMTVVPDAAGYLAKRRVAVIGPVAQMRAAALGVRVDIVPRAATVEALVDALALETGS